jgi:uncharacterized protein YkwD
MRPMTTRLLTLATLLALLALAGCGGGGDGDEPAGAASPAPISAPAPDPVPGPATAGTRATCDLPNFEAEALALVNAYRAAGASCGSAGSFAAAPPLAWNAALTQASLAHSDDMVAFNFVGHTGTNGSSAGDRATAAGYVWQSWGENVAAGQPTLAVVMAGWMASPGHCANVMRAGFRDIGLACVKGGAGNTYRTYWTMTLGAPR